MPVRITSNTDAFAKQIADVPKNLRKELRPRLRKAAERIVTTARSNASWSSRIPAALRVEVRARSGVQIVADKATAPHARLYEFGQDRRGFRHPVFGNMDVWVQEQTRPFLIPAVVQHGQNVVQEIQEAIEESWRGL